MVTESFLTDLTYVSTIAVDSQRPNQFIYNTYAVSIFNQPPYNRNIIPILTRMIFEIVSKVWQGRCGDGDSENWLGR